MRWVLLVLFVLLAACGGGRAPTPQPRPQTDIRQCLMGLERAGVRYRSLPDRHFGGGCQATGSVQLLDVGVPVTNLTALTCPMAAGLADWSRTVRQIARERLGSDIAKIESFGSYACRPVNNQTGGRLSEHARANAADIAAFVLADGRRITVEHGWGGTDPRVRDFLRMAHRAGCRRFAIGLGPDSDRFHYNHFHFDMGRGPYCR
ncbi:hypothetical protein BSL82_00315 [Tardibacter chloracetimidivorans]|uniref:Extensin-like C-terminal domain-containing protein n=1 Tax=Tardibacter chloracetimidivorans TaxID=1921510 RepID=A0A1L3ZZ00_9SPHN|nr:extensin family protein [Tardibacter chloracetimidivorans]API60861.1 hypothetical protein BSL82_00315 [Tardibacter chloracetimidivorans]